MKINISETPERWVIIKLPYNNYKVFGTWSGGYLGVERWKLNSGIKKIEQDDSHYYFIGFSGSCYMCHKKGYGDKHRLTVYEYDELRKALVTGSGLSLFKF